MALEKCVINLEKFFKKSENVNKLKKCSYMVLGALVLIDFLFIHPHHVYFIWDKIPGFHAFYGLIACFLIIRGAKGLAYSWLYKPENYYD